MKKKFICFIAILMILPITIGAIGISLISNTQYEGDFYNSIYESGFYSNKRVMIIVPHEDDEINIAGATIQNYIKYGSEVFVVYVTNGDYCGLGETRIQESISAMKKLGVNEKNLIFLGYGDQWNTKYGHIYHAPKNEVIQSHIGYNRTYGNKFIQDFRTQIKGKPAVYTRNNLKKDMRMALELYNPDTIFCVDFDAHPDHRVTSLIFEEALCELLKEKEEYNPDVYKGFAYNTSWNADDDFYATNMKSSIKPHKESVQNIVYELDTPNYDWEDRVRLPVPRETLTYTKMSNPIYKVLRRYKTQKADLQAGAIINSDQVFFERQTDSVTYNSKLEVSSGEASYLNDFKLIDTSDVCKRQNVLLDKCIWTPDDDDNKKYVTINFDNEKDIESISLYDNYDLKSNILNGRLLFSDGTEIKVGELKKNGARTNIDFEKKYHIKWIKFIIDQYEGETPGLSEIEVYEHRQAVTPEYIKLCIDDENETFLYRYLVENENIVPLKIYSYPQTINKNEYEIKILDDRQGAIQIKDDNLVISNDRIPGVYKVRVQLKNNKKIYDEIEVVIPNKYQKSYVDNVIKIENFYKWMYYSIMDRINKY